MNLFFLEVITRDGCHLCEEAIPVVQRVARAVGGEVRLLMVNEDPELAVDYDLRIPVVRGPSGRELAEGRMSFLPLFLAAVRERIRLGVSLSSRRRPGRLRRP